MQTVNVPGVGSLSFPDGMSQPEMAAAIQKNYPQIHPKPAPKLMDSALFNNPLVGAGELALQGVSSIPTLVSKGLTGALGMLRNGRAGMQQTAKEIAAAPDFTYEPSTDSAKAADKVLELPGKAINALAMARAQGPVDVNPMLLAKAGMRVPTNESPEASALTGAGIAVLGNALPAAAMGPGLVRALAKSGDYLNPAVQAGNVMREVAGTEEQRAAQAAALRNAPPPVTQAIPNGGVTAAQATANVPEGTTIQALQRAVAQSPDKGVSVDFARRFAAQKAAAEQATAELNTLTEPLRTKALEAAKARGGVSSKDLLADLAEQASSPETAGTPVARKTVSATAQFIRDNTDANGMIDPALLYQYRKTGVKQVIAESAGTDINALKHAQIHTERGIKQAIDTGIIKAGGTDWPEYLKTYSEGIKPIKALEDSTAEMYSPQQRTSLGENASMATGPGAPHLISKAASLTNYGLGLRRAVMGKSVNRHIANAMLDPAALADVLENNPKTAGIQGQTTFAALVADRLRQQQQQDQQ